MRKSRFLIVLVLEIVILIAFHGLSRAQSFHKGALMISLSEGSTHTVYTTNNMVTNDGGKTDHINGDRDPLTVEYGLSNHFGIGLNMGTDIIKVNPETFYGFKVSKNYVNAYMSEITVDGYYHFFNTRHTD
jgi:hypothetical protein